MWLFDDILKKPVNQPVPTDPLGSNMSSQGGGQSTGQGGSQGGGQPQQSAPTGTIFIQKTSEETVFGPQSEALSIEKENAPSPMPTVHAEADTSSILISTPTPVAPMISTTPAEMPVMIESVSMMNAPTPIIIPTQSAPMIMSTPESSVSMATGISTPVETMIIPAQMAQEPLSILAPTVSIDPIIPIVPVIAPTPTVNNSIFDSIMSPEPVPAIVVPEIPATLAVAPAPIVVAPSTPLASTPVVFTSTHNFSTPREFIEKSIANIDTMLVNIDGRHTAKEIEEESYRIEKLRFTDLEKNAHTEKIIMDKERDHAIHMRKILETELERDKANKYIEGSHANHVESTLTEIGTEHPVHRHAHKKTESRSHEELPTTA